ncbi:MULTISPECIES: hypothetical protein [Haloferax]|uniref:Glycoside hydrolase domain protein n=1 Tax=Haloferax marinum TaxID=2666143 RepID=A0A6A8G2E4_9EURY|nr:MULTISPECIES: hypothetical protein [Haloferax]KAB1196324.1 hypothetical protein Hfx1150_01840 [Haloferax sp. CBA1150]MRW95314.1 hypothetical protein [Haloferax marinum]
MYGVVTRNEDEIDWPEFDRGFYEVKDVTGRAAEPLSNAVNMISCFGDNAAANESPELVPVDADGNLATRDRTYFDWAYICPTNEKYRAGLLEIVEDAAAANGDVRLDDVGFPRDEYCHCDRCTRLFGEWADEHERDPEDDEAWFEWRTEVITDFVADAADRIPGRLYLTLYPDPYPGHLHRRAGLDVEALSDYVDEFVVPLYDLDYGTTYWLETIARGFVSLLDPYDVDFSIELYAVDVDVDNLVHAIEVADEYATDVLFGYDASNAAATLRRMTADGKEGKTFRPEDATR